MKLKINNQSKQFATDSLTVRALIDLEIPIKQNGIARAINNWLIPKIRQEQALHSRNR
jgi:sulfur carrier protein